MAKKEMTAKDIAAANAADMFLADVLNDWLKFRVQETAKIAGITDMAKANTFVAGNRGKANWHLRSIAKRIASRSAAKVESKADIFGADSE